MGSDGANWGEPGGTRPAGESEYTARDEAAPVVDAGSGAATPHAAALDDMAHDDMAHDDMAHDDMALDALAPTEVRVSEDAPTGEEIASAGVILAGEAALADEAHARVAHASRPNIDTSFQGLAAPAPPEVDEAPTLTVRSTEGAGDGASPAYAASRAGARLYGPERPTLAEPPTYAGTYADPSAQMDYPPAPAFPVSAPAIARPDQPVGPNRMLVIFGGAIGVFILASLVLVLAHNAFGRAPAGPRILYRNAMSGATHDGWWNDDTYRTSCFFKGDGYHIVSASNCYYSNADYADVEVSATAKLLSGDPAGAYGIAFRRPSKDNFYSFLITGTGNWLVLKGGGALQKSTPSAAIKRGLGAVNHLRVRMQGDRLTFYVNDTKLGTLTDGSYASGKVGLAGDQGLDVVFTDFEVRQV